jgi:3-deoxy-7-phosphoheptulonate synthase
MIDVHPDPESALCDGPQALTPDEMLDLGRELERLAATLGRPFNTPTSGARRAQGSRVLGSPSGTR